MTTDPERPRSSAAAETAWRLEMGVPKGSDVRLTGYPAAPQTPSTEAEDDRLVEPPDPAIWQDVVGRCPTCGTIIKGRLAIEREAADRAAPRPAIDVEVLARAMQTIEPPEPDMDIVASANSFAMDWVAWARLLTAEYDRLRGSR